MCESVNWSLVWIIRFRLFPLFLIYCYLCSLLSCFISFDIYSVVESYYTFPDRESSRSDNLTQSEEDLEYFVSVRRIQTWHSQPNKWNIYISYWLERSFSNVYVTYPHECLKKQTFQTISVSCFNKINLSHYSHFKMFYFYQ